MARLVVAVLGLILYWGGTASAEWVKTGGTHKYDGYVDMSTIAPPAQLVTMWTLKDFTVTRQIPAGDYRSVKTKRQYDCKNQRSRPLSVKYYAGQMAKGRLLFAGKGTREWSRVTPTSEGHAEMSIACKQPST
ncbi:MAG: hypothetical protein U0361_03910 [Nitrospiraceae bacterium]